MDVCEASGASAMFTTCISHAHTVTRRSSPGYGGMSLPLRTSRLTVRCMSACLRSVSSKFDDAVIVSLKLESACVQVSQRLSQAQAVTHDGRLRIDVIVEGFKHQQSLLDITTSPAVRHPGHASRTKNRSCSRWSNTPRSEPSSQP